MAKFITNIQLQDADEKDYDILCRELEKASFKAEPHVGKSDAYIPQGGSFSREGSITLHEVSESLTRVVQGLVRSILFQYCGTRILSIFFRFYKFNTFYKWILLYLRILFTRAPQTYYSALKSF